MFFWLVWGLFMVDLGFIYLYDVMMFLKGYLQYKEEKKNAEKQKSR